MSGSLRSHGLQHARPPCLSPNPGVYLNSCPLSRWYHPAIASSRPFLLPSVFTSIRIFSNESALCYPMDCSTPGFPVHHQLLELTSNSRPSSQWWHPTILSSVVPFSSCLQSFPASGSFPMSQLFASAGQSIGVSASTSVLPMNTQDWSPLRWTGWISLQPKGLSRVFSNTTVQKHQFFGTQLSSQSNSRIHTWPLGKP